MRISLRRTFFALALPVALATSGCGAVTPPASTAAGGAPAPHVLAKPAIARSDAKLPSQLLFVPDMKGSVFVYPLKDPEATGPVGLMTGLLGLQMQSAVDAKGNFYIASQGSGLFIANQFYVAKFAPPYTGAPTLLSTTWHGATFAAIGVTVDRKGNVYVSACGDYCAVDPSLRGVLVYPPGATTPKKYITAPFFDSVGALTIDTAGDVYGMTWNARVGTAAAFEIAAGTSKVKPLWLHGFYGPGDTAGGIAVDTEDNLYVTNPQPDGAYVLVFKRGQHEPFRQIDTGAWVQMAAFPMFLNVGPDGNLYVPVSCGAGSQANDTCPQVYVYPGGGAKPLGTLGSQIGGATTISVATFPNPMLQGSHQ